MSKKIIMDAVKSALKANKIKPPKLKVANMIRLAEKNLVDEYIANQSANKSEIVRVKKDGVLDAVNKILGELGGVSVVGKIKSLPRTKIAGEILKYDSPVDGLREEMFSANNAVIEVRAGVANLGIVGLVSEPANARLSSLVVENAIFLLNEKDIVECFADALAKMRVSTGKKGVSGDMPTNMIFVAGPSRTADIELQTVFGVHGPRRTFVVLYK